VGGGNFSKKNCVESQVKHQGHPRGFEGSKEKEP
jgi:hypothetical protein